jgi:hypothetical protein
MTLKNKKCGKYEVCDGLYSFLLCVIKVEKIQSSSHIKNNVLCVFFMINNI